MFLGGAVKRDGRERGEKKKKKPHRISKFKKKRGPGEGKK